MARPLSTSIAWKLTVANTLVSGAALLLAGLAFGAYDRATFGETLLRHLSTEAQIAASNSVSALVFNDPKAAEVTLAALRASPNIVSAEISTLEGRTFATYRRDRAAQTHAALMFPDASTEVHHVDSEQIVLARGIIFNGKQVGHVEIRSDLGEVTVRRAQYLVIVVAVLLASLSAASSTASLGASNLAASIATLSNGLATTRFCARALIWVSVPVRVASWTCDTKAPISTSLSFPLD